MLAPARKFDLLPKDMSIDCLTASFRLRDALSFDLDFDAKMRPAAEAAKSRLVNNLRVFALASGNDGRLVRLADLVKNAVPTLLKKDERLNNPNTHRWWSSVSSDKLPEWFAPFIGESPRTTN